MTQYPHDEFDVVPENARREGSHRSFVRLRDPRTGIWTLIVIGVVALAVGAIMFFVVHPQMQTASGDTEPGTSQGEDSGDDGASDDASGSAAPTSSAPAPSSDGSQAPSNSASPSDSASPSTDASPSSGDADADLSAPVGVYNGTGRSGLATGSASTLKSSGYTNVTTANWTKRTSVSAVYYKSAASKATAEAVASRLKIGTVVQTANIPSSISVVIGTDRSSSN